MRTFLTVLAGTLAFAATASAQDLTTGHLAAVDANGDGVVDAAEFDAFVAAAFQALDTNADGFIAEVEAVAVMTPEHFAAADTNGDGGLSAAEFAAQAQADFAAADRDGDGALN